MASLTALHRRELRRPNDDIYADETFRRIFHSSRRMVRRIKQGLHDDLKLSDFCPPAVTGSLQWHDLMPDEILEAVCDEAGVSRETIRSPRKARSAARPRMLACWLMKQHTNLSLPEIGRRVSRDHTTVMHACKVVPVDLERNGEMRALYERVRDRLGL